MDESTPPNLPTIPVVPPPNSPTHSHSPSPAAPIRRRPYAWLWITLGLVVLVGGGTIVAVAIALGQGLKGVRSASRGGHGADQLAEVVIEDNGAEDKVAVISVEGVITGQPTEPGGRTLVDLVRDQLDRIQGDTAVKAVILKVDSPGGEVLASDEIYRLLWEFVEDNAEKPVVVSMGSLAASGGYYVSAPCQWIVANELTMTGSIGVIFHGYNYRGLMDKVGVRPEITKSGKLKDMMSGEKRPDEELPEEHQIMQSMIDESFARFKQVVRDGRERAAKLNEGEGRKLADDWENIADGRILSGRSALEKGLVDELGNFDVAVQRAMGLAGVEKANLVSFEAPPGLSSLFRMLGETKASPGTVKVDLGIPFASRLPQGRLYFLSPMHEH